LGSSALDDAAEVRRVSLGNGPQWQDATRADIEAIVGGRLAELPSHDELYSRVLALGGGTKREILRDIFEAVPVVSLPLPPNPARCQHRDRFAPISAQHQAEGKD
jgi:hypothetical protein